MSDTLVTRAVDARKRQQWEASSGSPAASQSNNCGPTCITFIACFYRDDYNIGIEQTRRQVTGCCAPTTSTQQRDMLIARGVPAATVWIDSLTQIDELVGDDDRPIVIGVQMSRVPATVRDHPFLGWHAIVIMGLAVVNGVPGYWVMDPNFSPPNGYRPDPDDGKKFYSRPVLQYAYIGNSIRNAIAPLRKKKVYRLGGLPVNYNNEVGKAVTIRSDKPMRSAAHLDARSYGRTKMRRTMRLWASTTEGQTVDGSRKWYIGSLFVDGRNRTVYIPKTDTLDYRSV